jgi:hypothetical protein
LLQERLKIPSRAGERRGGHCPPLPLETCRDFLLQVFFDLSLFRFPKF